MPAAGQATTGTTDDESELNETAAVVATALWAVLLAVKDRAVVNRPQAGGYKPARRAKRFGDTAFRVKRDFVRRPLRLDRLFHSRPLYFVTFCTYRRRKWLARDDVHQAFVDFATNAHRKFNIAVGRYVIMPEHVHLFACGDAAFVLGRWIGQLKQALARAAGLTRQSSQVWQAQAHTKYIWCVSRQLCWPERSDSAG